ncbi:MAG: hypothetical protein QOI10_984 [Solirubrobacterales bacterium]|nr:hypothetical protein [Solirubrobacterales bacterium]
MSSIRSRFGGAAAIAFALGLYALVSIGGDVAFGGPADLDTSFDGDGLAQKAVPVSEFSFARVADAVIQGDGKYVVAGSGDVDLNGRDDLVVVRFMPDGSVDTGFGTMGIATASFADNVTASAVALDGSSPQKIVVAGTQDDHTFDEDDDFAVARFNDNGTLDTNTDGDPVTHFSTDGKLTTDIVPPSNNSQDLAGDVAVLPSGAVLVGGGSRLGGQARAAFARYLADGTADASFSTDGQSVANVAGADMVRRMVVDTGASTITAALGPAVTIAGLSTKSDLIAGRFLLNGATAGTLDTTFSGGDGLTQVDFGASTEGANSLAVEPGGAIVVAGGTSVDSSMGVNSDFALARLDSSGALDPTFSGGKVQTSFGAHTGSRGSVANDVAIQPDGKIVAGGFTRACGFSGRFATARYNADGTLDTTFSGDGKSIVGPERAVAVAVLLPASDKVVLAGTAFANPDDLFTLAKYGTVTADSNPSFCQTSLTVSLAGSGSGTVTGTGINCPGDCVEAGDPGETFDDLTATPASGSTFTGWEGNPDCDPPTDADCFITVGTNTTVTARFDSSTPTTTTTTPTTTTTTPATDTTPPETTIVKGPKKKTPKTKATLTFTSSEPGSTFECALAGKKVKKKLKKFLPCSSPTKYKKLKTGKKKFQVRATDPAGNLDSTPAAKKWKVKPKKK